MSHHLLASWRLLVFVAPAKPQLTPKSPQVQNQLKTIEVGIPLCGLSLAHVLTLQSYGILVWF